MYKKLDLQILKVLTQNKKYALDFVSSCDVKIFSPEVWNFANIVINYIKAYKDVPTLRILLEKNSKNEKLMEHIKNIWSHLEETPYDDKEYKHDLERLKNRFSEKQLVSVKDQMNNIDFNSLDVDKTVGSLQKTIQNIKNLSYQKTYDSKSLKDALPWFTEHFKLKKEDPNFNKGIPTGYSFIDYATNGVKPSDFVLVCGESGHGKSTLLANIAMNIWKGENKIGDEKFIHSGKIF